MSSKIFVALNKPYSMISSASQIYCYIYKRTEDLTFMVKYTLLKVLFMWVVI